MFFFRKILKDSHNICPPRTLILNVRRWWSWGHGLNTQNPDTLKNISYTRTEA